MDLADKREKQAQSKLYESRAQLQKFQTLVKQAQRAALTASSLLKKKKVALVDAKNRNSRPKGADAFDIERSSSRVKDVLDVLSLTADKRRDKLNQKRTSSSNNSWVQTLPGISSPLRKSLWHKMHRRRQQIVLRPSYESLVSDLQAIISKNHATTKTGSLSTKTELLEQELLKAEQLLLLAIHPAAPTSNRLSSVPPSSSNDQWAEPGT